MPTSPPTLAQTTLGWGTPRSWWSPAKYIDPSLGVLGFAEDSAASG